MIDTELEARLERMNGIWPGRPLKAATLEAWHRYLKAHHGVQLDRAIDALAVEMDRMPALRDVLRVMHEQAGPEPNKETTGGVLCWEIRPRRNIAQLQDLKRFPLSAEQRMTKEFPPDQLMTATQTARERGWDLYAIMRDDRP